MKVIRVQCGVIKYVDVKRMRLTTQRMGQGNKICKGYILYVKRYNII